MGITGLRNVNNSCFLNSAIQLLRHSRSDKQCTARDCVLCIDELAMHRLVKEKLPNLMNGDHQDAAECIQAILSHDNHITTCTGATFWRSLVYSQKCQSCHCSSPGHIEPTNTLRLPIKKNGDSIQSLMDSSFRNDVSDFCCPRCGRMNSTSQETTFTSLPDNLIIQLERFTPSQSKLEYLTVVPKELELTHLDQKVYYQCKSAIEHQGSEIRNGHYISHLLTADGWYTADDDKVRPNPSVPEQLGKAYVICFEKIRSCVTSTSQCAEGAAAKLQNDVANLPMDGDDGQILIVNSSMSEAEQQELNQDENLLLSRAISTIALHSDSGAASNQLSVADSIQDLKIRTDKLVSEQCSHKEIADQFEKDIKRICEKDKDFDRWVPEEIYKPIVQRIVRGEYSSAWFETLLNLPHSRYRLDRKKYDAARDEFLNVAVVTCMTEFEEVKCSKDLKQGDLERSCNLYKDLLQLFSQYKLGNAMFKGKQRCLLTSIALHDRCDIIEYALDVDRLRDYKMNPTTGDNKRCQLELNEIPLPQSTIQLLNKLTRMYITPHGKEERTQGGLPAAKKYGFAYYNIIGRECDANPEDAIVDRNQQHPIDEEITLPKSDKEQLDLKAIVPLLNQAEEEAHTVLTWLHDTNFVFRSKKNWTVDELPDNLKKEVEAIKDNCSVVVVFLMAHGYEGYVTDVNGTPISLDVLDDIINNAIPENIPKIFIVQACRTLTPSSTARESGEDGGMFSRTQPIQEPDKQIADPKDFVRIMATSKGQKAYRNTFLPLLINELRQGTEFLKAEIDAARGMPRNLPSDQTPQPMKRQMVNPIHLHPRSTKHRTD